MYRMIGLRPRDRSTINNFHLLCWSPVTKILIFILYPYIIYFFLTFIYFTSLREQDEAYTISSRWSKLVGLELAYIRMWVAHSTTVLQTQTYSICHVLTQIWFVQSCRDAQNNWLGCKHKSIPPAYLISCLTRIIRCRQRLTHAICHIQTQVKIWFMLPTGCTE